jgi:large subunit ribosomal protein L17
LIKGLVCSLVEHGRIKTTLAKAKELRRHVEKAITVGKRPGLATRRLLISRLGSKSASKAIVEDISGRFSERAGGYTRIIKIGKRPGDSAEMAFIEFVDFDWKSKQAAKSAE